MILRTSKLFSLSNREIFYRQMLNWSNRFNICSFADNHNYKGSPNFQETVLAAGAVAQLDFSSQSSMEEIRQFIKDQNDWIFFHLSFESISILKKERKEKPDPIGFLPFCFFVPQYVLIFKEDHIEISSLADDHEEVFETILLEAITEKTAAPVDMNARVSKERYLDKLNGLLGHIHRGDCYEINYCQEFYNEAAVIDPLSTWLSLCRISPNPFSVFYKSRSSYLLCASPERFLCRKGNTLISQPMKGTIQRDVENPTQDNALRMALQESKKDQRENVMVVDLVRNDLSRVCKEGTVKVTELFGVYSFPQVYQMISTIEGECKKGVDFMDILEACFPMGSMTGAPKHRVLELIREYEEGPRGLFSGSVGYINPDGNFDMNVVIRSVFYNADSGYVSYMTGSGITASSIPQLEYEECLLKGKAIRKVLS